MKLLEWGKGLFLLALLIALAACSGGNASEKGSGASAKRPVPVVIAPVEQKPVPVQLTAIGTVEAHSTIMVKAQIGGELTRVHFEEGQDVKRGDMLFTIDPRPYEVALQQAKADLAKSVSQKHQAEANLARSKAQAKDAQTDLVRYESVVKKGAVAKETYDKVKTNAESLEATVRADEAAVENASQVIHSSEAAIEDAKIKLEYSTIRSPINGRTGNLLVHQGNLVKANADTAMVTINQIQPIEVRFSVPEQYLPVIKKFTAAGKLKVKAVIPHDDGPPVEGELTFINNEVDRATGTIQLKGSFSNQDRRLWPGQFVNVALTLTVQANAVVAPSQAIQTGQQGAYVFVIKPDLIAESRPVAVGSSLDGMVVVEKGLKPGENVVIDGQLNLTPGALVEIKKNVEEVK